jgi:hypothetical protein
LAKEKMKYSRALTDYEPYESDNDKLRSKVMSIMKRIKDYKALVDIKTELQEAFKEYRDLVKMNGEYEKVEQDILDMVNVADQILK